MSKDLTDELKEMSKRLIDLVVMHEADSISIHADKDEDGIFATLSYKDGEWSFRANFDSQQ